MFTVLTRQEPSRSSRPDRARPGRSRQLVRAAALPALLAVTACAREPDPYPGRDIVLCYRTLADVSCYDRPDSGRDGRLVGFWLRAPLDPRSPATALAVARSRAPAPER